MSAYSPFTIVALTGALLIHTSASFAESISIPRSGFDDSGVLFKDGFPVTDRKNIFPLHRIKRGQKGVGYTVLAGDEIKRFDVEILGVLEGMLGPDEDVILAKLGGQDIEFTGVISGMSGSPVYINGSLVGAVSYRFGSFSKEPIAGITPIERMLPIVDKLHSQNRIDARHRPIDTPVASQTKDPDLYADIEAQNLRQTATPIGVSMMASGITSKDVNLLNTLLKKNGYKGQAAKLTPQLGSGASYALKRGRNTPAQAGRVRAAPIKPGAPIAVLLAKGDINITGIGTVSYVEGNQVLAFGHPFVDHGNVSFPMATASIINTLASPAGSYKQGIAAQEVGIISQDRLTAIGGLMNQGFAEMVPISIQVKDETNQKVYLTNVDVVPSSPFLPTLAATTIASTALKRLDAEVGGRVKMRTSIRLDNRAIFFEETYSAEYPDQVAARAANDINSVLRALIRNPWKLPKIEKILVELDVHPKSQITVIESVGIKNINVKPGDKIKVKVNLRNYQHHEPSSTRTSKRTTKTIDIQIPNDVSGQLKIHVAGGRESDKTLNQLIGNAHPEELDDLLAILNSRKASHDLCIRTYFKQPGLAVANENLEALPLSHRSILQTQTKIPTKSLEQRAGEAQCVKLSGRVAGQKTMTVNIVR